MLACNDADVLSHTDVAFDRLLGKRLRIGVAVSGGSDSLALMLLLARWAAAQERHIRVLTIDHGLRPESASEAAYVADLAAQHGFDCDIVRRQTSHERDSPPMQARLRDDRHRLFAQWATTHDIRVIALGHTADDRIETLLMRARAGSDWYGLAAPLPSGASPVWPEGMGISIVRPVAGLARAALQEWLHDQGIAWHRDPNNHNHAYERTRMRSLVAARLGMNDRSRALRIWHGLAIARATAMASLRALCDEAVMWHGDGSVCVDYQRWTYLSAETRLRLLHLLILVVSGQRHGPRIRACRALAARLGNTHSASLGGSWLAVSGKAIEIVAAPRKNARSSGARPCPPKKIFPDQECVWDGRFTLNLHAGTPRIVVNRDDARDSWLMAELASAASATSAASAAVTQRATRSLPVLHGACRTGEKLAARALHRQRADALLADPVLASIGVPV